jgi:hypothetical protein
LLIIAVGLPTGFLDQSQFLCKLHPRRLDQQCFLATLYTLADQRPTDPPAHTLIPVNRYNPEPTLTDWVLWALVND